VLSSNDCPIDDIIITNQPLNDIKYKSRELADDYKIYFTSQAYSLPIVDFRLTEGQVCIFPSQFDSTDQNAYPLLRTWRNDGCKDSIKDIQYDNRWNQTTSRTHKQVIDDNPEFEETVSDLQGFVRSDTPWNLFIHTYVDWKLECQNSEIAKMNRIAEDNNPINTLANVQLIYMIITFLSLLIIGLISPGFVIYKQVLSLIGRQEVDQDIIASNGMRLIAAIFIVLKLSFLVSAMVIIKNFTSIVDYVEKNNCTDETTLAIFLFLRGVLLDAYNQNLFGLITVSIMAAFEIIAIIILVILSCVVKKKNKNKEANMFVKYK